MNREVEFAKTLEEVKRKAREQQNFITKMEVEEAFSALSLSAEQMEMVYDYLRQNKIGVDEPADADACLDEEEKNYLDDYLEALRAIPRATDGEREAITLPPWRGMRTPSNGWRSLCCRRFPRLPGCTRGRASAWKI